MFTLYMGFLLIVSCVFIAVEIQNQRLMKIQIAELQDRNHLLSDEVEILTKREVATSASNQQVLEHKDAVIETHKKRAEAAAKDLRDALIQCKTLRRSSVPSLNSQGSLAEGLAKIVRFVGANQWLIEKHPELESAFTSVGEVAESIQNDRDQEW